MSILRAEVGLAEALARLALADRVRALAELQSLADDPAEPRLLAPDAAMLHFADAAVDSGDIEGARRELARARDLVDAARGGADLREWVRRRT